MSGGFLFPLHIVWESSIVDEPEQIFLVLRFNGADGNVLIWIMQISKYSIVFWSRLIFCERAETRTSDAIF